jgi:hypothetical protein
MQSEAIADYVIVPFVLYETNNLFEELRHNYFIVPLVSEYEKIHLFGDLNSYKLFCSSSSAESYCFRSDLFNTQ